MDNLNQFRTFLAVYQHSSISNAAKQLNLTQPAVSKQLQQLEARMNRQLFVRVARGVEATPAAHDLARQVSSHLEALENISNALKLGAKTLAGTVFLGGPAEFIGQKILPVLHSLPEHQIQIRVQLEQPENLKTALLSGALDLAIFTVRRSDAKLTSAALYQEELVLVGNRKWKENLPQEGLNAGILEQVPLLGYSEDLPLIRRYWRKIFNTLPKNSAAMVIPDLRALENATVAGYGVTVLPKYLIENSLRNGTLFELQKPNQFPTNQLYLGWHNTKLHPRVVFVRDLLMRVLERPKIVN
jgi:DNA-binding transcriptional LysR family regulator